MQVSYCSSRLVIFFNIYTSSVPFVHLYMLGCPKYMSTLKSQRIEVIDYRYFFLEIKTLIVFNSNIMHVMKNNTTTIIVPCHQFLVIWQRSQSSSYLSGHMLEVSLRVSIETQTMIEKETKASQTLYKRFTQASRNTNKRHPEKVLGDKKILVASHNLDWATINSLLHFVHETKQYKIKMIIWFYQPRYAMTKDY